MQGRSEPPTTENSVYRAPGRVLPDAPIPPPARGVLFSPLARGIGWVVVLLTPAFVFNVLLAEPLFHISKEVRFIPVLASIQDVLAVTLLLALPILIHRLVRRVRPSWSGMRQGARIVYVTAIVLAQVSVIGAAEFALMQSRGGFPLWEPTLRTTTTAPDSRTAYLYAGGFGCEYDVYVADPYAITMTRKMTMARKTCQEATPRVDFKADGGLDLLGADGKPLAAESSSWGFWWGGGC